MENLNEGLKDWAIKKYNDLKSNVQREGKETVLAAKIILKWMNGSKPSGDQVDFLKNQSVDIAKALGLIGIQFVPGGQMTVLALDKVFEKYKIPFTFYPNSHKKDSTQKFRDRHKVSEIVAEEVRKLMQKR